MAQLLTLGWGVLEDVPGKEVVRRCRDRPWEPEVVFRSLPPEQFASFAEPGFVKITVSLRADPLSEGSLHLPNRDPCDPDRCAALAKVPPLLVLRLARRVPDPLDVVAAVEGGCGAAGKGEHTFGAGVAAEPGKSA